MWWSAMNHPTDMNDGTSQSQRRTVTETQLEFVELMFCSATKEFTIAKPLIVGAFYPCFAWLKTKSTSGGSTFRLPLETRVGSFI